MADLTHLGRETAAETGYALVCNAVRQGGDPDAGPICGQPAKYHLRWEPETTENSFACEEHTSFAFRFNPHDVHDVENSACGMPGTYWVPGPPRSYCTMLALDEEPELAGAVEEPVGAAR